MLGLESDAQIVAAWYAACLGSGSRCKGFRVYDHKSREAGLGYSRRIPCEVLCLVRTTWFTAGG